MRQSNRDRILATAIELIEAHGLDAVTYDSLAEATGLSKSGIIYHFPSRHALLLALHEHVAHAWEQELERCAGGSADSLPADARLRAVVLSLSHTATRADLFLCLDAHSHPDFLAVWERTNRRWMPLPTGVESDETRRLVYLVQVLADGLWLHDHVHEAPLTASQRETLTAAILDLIPACPSGQY